MNFETWLAELPESLKNDSLWKMTAYRLGLFLAELSWHDVTKLMKDGRTRSMADQLFRAVGSISANLAEGYSRGSGKDRARFYEYALGSARESRDWYIKGRHVLGEKVLNHRLELLNEIIPLLLTMIPQQRKHGRILRESSPHYQMDQPSALLAEIPLPADE